jgi:SAM-dependent methyltransferase
MVEARRRTDGDTDVARFFDRHAESYFDDKAGMAAYHALTAARIEAGVSGRVAAIGGVWAGANARRCRELDLTILDISPGMLEQWSSEGFETAVGDARATPFEDGSLDHVVYPGILHHITEGSFLGARREVRRVMQELARIVRPGGGAWISDFTIHTLVYALEGLAAPLTKRALGLSGIPLVVMHPAWFYELELRRAGFRDVEVFAPRPSEAPLFVRPVIGLDWLVVPRAVYPVTPILVSAIRARTQ